MPPLTLTIQLADLGQATPVLLFKTELAAWYTEGVAFHRATQCCGSLTYCDEKQHFHCCQCDAIVTAPEVALPSEFAQVINRHFREFLPPLEAVVAAQLIAYRVDQLVDQGIFFPETIDMMVSDRLEILPSYNLE